MWPDSSETQELLKHAADGDATAAGRLLDRHRAGLRRMVGARLDPMLQRRVDASDIVQEVMVEASRRLNDYLREPVMPFHLWLRQMARDRMIDAHRRHRQAARRSLDREQPLEPAAGLDRSTLQLAVQLCDGERTPAAAALWKELHRRFLCALESMDDTDREVVCMRHFEQLSNRDVAAALGLSEAAAGMRYLRALRRLRAMLAEPHSTSGAEP